MIDYFYNGHDVLLPPCEVWGDRTTSAGCRCLQLGFATKRQTDGIVFTQRPKKAAFSLRRGESLHPFRWNLAQYGQGARGSAWPCEISRQWVHAGGYDAPKSRKFTLTVKFRPAAENSTPKPICKNLRSFYTSTCC